MIRRYPADSNTYSISTQFMLGASLLVTPVLTEGDVTVSGYVPVCARLATRSSLCHATKVLFVMNTDP